MHSAWTLILALLEGILIGFVFFGGLWWTVKKGLISVHPASLFFGSLFARTTVAVVAFYFVSMEGWRPLILCLIGFIMGRILVGRFALNWATASTRVAGGGAS
jgi:F1F0 ATPase subunit 2